MRGALEGLSLSSLILNVVGDSLVYKLDIPLPLIATVSEPSTQIIFKGPQLQGSGVQILDSGHLLSWISHTAVTV